MQRFEKILFVYEDDTGVKAALQRAVKLANSNNAQLTLVSIVQELPRTLVNLQKTFLSLQQEQMQSAIGQMKHAEAMDIKTRILVGVPFLQIIREVLSGGHDLVVKPATGSSGVLGTLFGSTDLHLLRKCPCPVWIIKPSKQKKYSRILAAVDPDPAEPANAELNRLILDLATSLALRENSELHIAHVWSLPYEDTLRSGRVRMPNSEVDRLVRDTRITHKQWLSELVGLYDLGSISSKIHLLKGRPGVVLPALVMKKHIELLVMGTVARAGIPGFFIGNTAEKTLSAVDCSVLAVKPGAFTSPVAVRS